MIGYAICQSEDHAPKYAYMSYFVSFLCDVLHKKLTPLQLSEMSNLDMETRL